MYYYYSNIPVVLSNFPKNIYDHVYSLGKICVTPEGAATFNSLMCGEDFFHINRM